MHGVNHMQMAQTVMGEILVLQVPWDDTCDYPAVCKNVVGQNAHQTDTSPAVH